MEHVTKTSSGAPTADASHLTGSAIMTTTVATILMSKDVVSVKEISNRPSSYFPNEPLYQHNQ